MDKRIEILDKKLKALKVKEDELIVKKKNIEKLQTLSAEKRQRKIDNRLKILFGAVFLSNCSENDFKRLFKQFTDKDKGYIKKHLETVKIKNKYFNLQKIST